MWRVGITILHGVIWESLTYKVTFEQRPEGDEETCPSDTWGRAVQAQRASNAKPRSGESTWQIQCQEDQYGWSRGTKERTVGAKVTMVVD